MLMCKKFANYAEYCACGERAGECQFWQEVQKQWSILTGINDINELEKLRSKFERIRNLPYLLISQWLNTKEYQRYLNAAQTLYQAIAKVSGKKMQNTQKET